jgi:hypothetical protein
MGGGTGNIRTSHWQSSANGYKTLGSILAGSGGGAGGGRRIYGYYAIRGGNVNSLTEIFKINYGQYRNYSEFFVK